MRVLFIDIDTLRPDHMGCYGYHRNTTPNIDVVANEGMRFTNYYTPDAPCLPSRASLISGMFGIRHGAVGHGATAADRRLTGFAPASRNDDVASGSVPGATPQLTRDFRDPVDDHNFHNIFRKAGMHTASVSSFPERHSSWWFNAGLMEAHNLGQYGLESGEKVLPVALDWLDRKGADDNWYLHVHVWDPHTPYRAPEDFGEPFKDQPIKEWLTEAVFAQHKKHVGPHSILETGMFDDNVSVLDGQYCRQPGACETFDQYKKFLDGYDTGILYADYLMGQVFDKLKALGIYDDTAIIITSDHGENMGELGIYAEHGTADKATCNIPMILKWPGLTGGRVDNGLHYNIDLLPTLCDLLGVDSASHWDGLSYYEALTSSASGEQPDSLGATTTYAGPSACTGRPYLVVSQNAHVCQRSVVFDGWLYIRTIHDGYHLFDKEMLFHLETDPYEQFDLKAQHPEICAQGAKYILDWQEDQMAKNPQHPDPMWTVMSEGGPFHTQVPLGPYIERLKATGRAEGAKQLVEKYLK